MKTKSSRFIQAFLAVAIASPAFALEGPEDDAMPPPPSTSGGAAAGLPVIPLPRAAKPAKAMAFLGVISSETPDMLAEHLDLKQGEGVVVRSVVPDSPAAKAGVSLNDIITKVSGEPVGTPVEISKQIGTHKPGDTITLELIHKGKPAKVDVTLGIKPAELAAAELQPLQQLDMDGLPKELAQRVRDAIAGNIGGLDIQQGQVQGQIPPGMENALRDLQNRMQAMGGNFQAPGIPNTDTQTESHSESTVRMKDDEGSVEVKSKDGAKEVTIRDTDNNVIWSGPWNNAKDQAAAPAKIRDRVASLNLDTNFKGNGLRLQMGGQRPRNVLPPAPPEPPKDDN